MPGQWLAGREHPQRHHENAQRPGRTGLTRRRTLRKEGFAHQADAAPELVE
ncbi:MAG: hypothetical protein L0H83_04235 [Salinisphaera sp.]|nr:hypothetical protein [Salinisphaera sp.]